MLETKRKVQLNLMCFDPAKFDEAPEVYHSVDLSISHRLLGVQFVKCILKEDQLADSYVALVM